MSWTSNIASYLSYLEISCSVLVVISPLVYYGQDMENAHPVIELRKFGQDVERQLPETQKPSWYRSLIKKARDSPPPQKSNVLIGDNV